MAKTGRGKSSLLLRIAQHLMDQEPRGALVLVDPHRDLAEAGLALVPQADPLREGVAHHLRHGRREHRLPPWAAAVSRTQR